MEKWIPSLPTMEKGFGPWKTAGPKKRGPQCGFPPASPLPHSGQTEPGSTFPQALRRVILFTKPLSLFNSTGHFTCYKKRTFSLANNSTKIAHSCTVETQSAIILRHRQVS
jgi:hypothetical protein